MEAPRKDDGELATGSTTSNFCTFHAKWMCRA
jgi:hypothetical protein